MSEQHGLHTLLHRLVTELAVMEQNNIERFNKIMSAVTDFAAKAQASLDKVSADLDSISKDITALNAQIAAFNNSSGTLSPADQAALDAIAASASALQTKADATVPPVLPTPPAA